MLSVDIQAVMFKNLIFAKVFFVLFLVSFV